MMKKKKKKSNSDNDNNTFITKTLVVNYKFSKSELEIIKFMSKVSKNIYNITIFCYSVFCKYREDIYEELYRYIDSLNIDIKKSTDKYIELVEQKLQHIFENKYNTFVSIKNNIENNNKIIYQYIINKIKNENILLNNNNYYDFKNNITNDLLKNREIKFDNNNNDELFYLIIDRICQSIYNRNFYNIKYKLINKIPIEINDNEFIEQVKNKLYLFKEKEDMHVNFKKKITDEFKLKLKSNRNYVSRFIYKHLNENTGLIPSDVIINIINKAFESINSYFAIKEKGLTCNYPKYLPKNSFYILPFFDRSRKEITINSKNKIRLTVGSYIAKNLLEITKDTSKICINKNQKTDYKKYICKSLSKKYNSKIKKSENFIFNGNINEKYYISKNSKHIQNAYYLNIPKPEKLNKNEIKIKMVEIIPLFDSHKFQIHYKYDEQIKKIESRNLGAKIEDYISIDLGIKNLMTIYNPSGKQTIISGKYLVKLNNSYNYKIDKLKSEAKKKNKKDTTKKIRKLLIRRTNKINNYFNLIVKWISKKYKTKKIIVGYNVNWKKGITMGKKNNRTFYQIPFCKLLQKLKFKMLQLGSELIINEESYTSKCDALALEDIKKQDAYMGVRTKRGLFWSSKKVYINADLNGAINIMRKYLKKINIKMNKILGESILNPIRINIFREAFSIQEETSGSANERLCRR